MKNSRHFLSILAGLTLLFLDSCKNENEIPEVNLLGHWDFTYELMDDGTKNYTDPYGLLEFEYSDAFTLYEADSGTAHWLGLDIEDFNWSRENDNLFIQLENVSGQQTEFQYPFEILSEKEIILNTPKGHRYLMTKD